MTAIFRYSRYVVFIAVIGLLVAAVYVFIFGGITTVSIIVESFRHGQFNAEGARVLSIELIEVIDLFLLGTVLYITSIGIQELFVDPAVKEAIPQWLSIDSLDQLKFNLLAVIVVMLAVLFLGIAASFELTEGRTILGFGIGVALVIIAGAIAAYLFAKVHHMRKPGQEEVQDILAEERTGSTVGSGTT